MATIGNVLEISESVPREPNGYFTVAEAAARLGVSRVSVWRWIRDGRIPAARLGRRTTRIHQQDLAGILAPEKRAPLRALDPRQAARDNRNASLELGAAAHSDVLDSDHFVQFYDADVFLVDAVSDFIGGGLRAGEMALVVATPEHRASLEECLIAHGLDVQALSASKRYLVLDAAETLAQFMVDGMPDAERFARLVGGLVDSCAGETQRLRVFGEMVALLANEGNDRAAVRLEELWNELQRGRRFSLMCGYSMYGLGGEPFEKFVGEVCREHSRVIPTESYTGLDRPADRLRTIAVLQQKARSLELEIEERKRTERALRHREGELRDFFEQGLMGMHWVAADGTILWANQAEMDLLGYSTAEYVGHHIAEFYVDRDVIEDVLSRLATHETISQREVRLRCKDGSIRHVLVSSNVLWDGDTFVHSRCFTVDITPRKFAEQQLAVQYATTRALSDSETLAEAVDAILACVGATLGWDVGALWLGDRETGLLRCQQLWHNPSVVIAEFEAASFALALSGDAGLPGRVWSTGRAAWIPNVLEDRNFPRAAQAAGAGLHSAFASPVRIGGETLGAIELFSREIMPSPDEDVLALMGGIAGQLGQFIERKRAQASAERERKYLRDVFTRAPAAVALVCGPDHVFEFANPLYVQIVGRSDLNELLGKPVREALPVLEHQSYLELLDEVYRTGKPFLGEELRVQMTSGAPAANEHYFNLLLQPSVDGAGRVEGILAHAVDVTEQVRARQRIEELAQQLRDQLETHVDLNRELRDTGAARDRAIADLQQLLRARDEFLSSAAHDLKNPLANMKAQAQILQRRVARPSGIPPEKLLAGLESIDGSATRMAALINDLLDTARVELGQPIELHRRATDLVALAERVIVEQRQATERHVIRIEAAETNIWGDWDAERLERVLINLLENAIKFSPDGGEVLVTIKHAQGLVELAVRDDGLGIPAADLPHVFKRFRRGANVVGRINGTGIGLAGVYSLVESHGGTIAVESQEGKGSRFIVRLPCRADAADSGY